MLDLKVDLISWISGRVAKLYKHELNVIPGESKQNDQTSSIFMKAKYEVNLYDRQTAKLILII